MNPHRFFLAILAISIPVTVVAFIKDPSELVDHLAVLGIVSSVVFAVMILTRKYWQGARRVQQ